MEQPTNLQESFEKLKKNLGACLSPELLQVHIFCHDPWEERAHGLPTFLHHPENSGQ